MRRSKLLCPCCGRHSLKIKETYNNKAYTEYQCSLGECNYTFLESTESHAMCRHKRYRRLSEVLPGKRFALVRTGETFLLLGIVRNDKNRAMGKAINEWGAVEYLGLSSKVRLLR